MKKKLLGYYDYTVILTYCGMLFGFYGLLHVTGGHYDEALVCLLLAGICDMFDGSVAATKDRTCCERRFGIQIDSLSDLISFGILPGLFVYEISGRQAECGLTASLFTLCALIRLAYFNVLEEERQEGTDEKRHSYLGLPVTSMAVLLPVVYLLYDFGVCKAIVCFPILLIAASICFLLPIEIRKPGIIGKISLVVIGMLEALRMLLFAGWDIL